MGLDIALGVFVLLSAIRGWFKGFLRQAITLSALVGCVYLADPLRELARPYAKKTFPSIGGDVQEKLLWWSSAVVAYIVTAGIATAILKASRKRPYGDPEPNRTDQGAGFTLGALRGFVIASFLAAGVANYAPGHFSETPMVEEQTKASRALEFHRKYHPALVIWESQPVRHFVFRVKSRGLGSGTDVTEPTKRTEVAKPEAESETPIRTAQSRPKTMAIPGIDPDAEDFPARFREEMKREGLNPDWR